MDFNQNNQSNNGYPPGSGGSNQTPHGSSYVPPYKYPGSGMANAAMILGIGAILTALMMTVYFPFILGSIAIVLALLSKGRAAKMAKTAKAGIACAMSGLTLNIIIIASTMFYLFSSPELLLETMRQSDVMYENINGVSTEETFGESLEDKAERFLGIE